MFSFYKILSIDIVGISNMMQIFFSIGFGFVHLALAIEERATSCLVHSECLKKDDVPDDFRRYLENEPNAPCFNHGGNFVNSSFNL